MLINKKKRICHQVVFAISADNKMKIKESEKIDTYLDLAREQKQSKLGDMNVTVIPIVVESLWIIS